MELSFIKKGEVINNFHKDICTLDYFDFRGKEAEILAWAKKEKVVGLHMHRVTGECAPYDEWYGYAYPTINSF